MPEPQHSWPANPGRHVAAVETWGVHTVMVHNVVRGGGQIWGLSGLRLNSTLGVSEAVAGEG